MGCLDSVSPGALAFIGWAVLVILPPVLRKIMAASQTEASPGERVAGAPPSPPVDEARGASRPLGAGQDMQAIDDEFGGRSEAPWEIAEDISPEASPEAYGDVAPEASLEGAFGAALDEALWGGVEPPAAEFASADAPQAAGVDEAWRPSDVERREPMLSEVQWMQPKADQRPVPAQPTTADLAAHLRDAVVLRELLARPRLFRPL